MRMWNVEPGVMCSKHLLGEHVEMHMAVGAILKGKSIQGFLDGGLLVTEQIRQRHDQLVREMQRRGMNHKSPLPEYYVMPGGEVNSEANLVELAHRCVKCAELQKGIE